MRSDDIKNRLLSLHVVILMTNIADSHPKGPVAINGDNEVDDIDEKHEGVDITHRTVFWVDDVIEELSYG